MTLFLHSPHIGSPTNVAIHTINTRRCGPSALGAVVVHVLAGIKSCGSKRNDATMAGIAVQSSGDRRRDMVGYESLGLGSKGSL